jgi:hypothetical protein
MTSLRERLGLGSAQDQHHKRIYERFGVLENPYPPASQPTNHPHMPTGADEEMERHLRGFLTARSTDAVVIEGTQGLGKTNLLEYYRDALSELLGDEEGYYIVKYYADPEPDFGGVIRRIVQDFGIEHLKEIGRRFTDRRTRGVTSQEIFKSVRGYESRRAFEALGKAAERGDTELTVCAELLLEYLSGLRLFKRHTERLNVQFRLDTTESQIQALHDLVYFSAEVDYFKGLFLFLDEMEKQAGHLQPRVTLRYLSAIRALIDALPKYLFLVLAMTDDARRRYAVMLPALAGRLQSVITLSPLRDFSDAERLYRFYLDVFKERAEQTVSSSWQRGTEELISPDRLQREFTHLLRISEQQGVQGVTQRRFLDQLHGMVEKRLTEV